MYNLAKIDVLGYSISYRNRNYWRSTDWVFLAMAYGIMDTADNRHIIWIFIRTPTTTISLHMPLMWLHVDAVQHHTVLTEWSRNDTCQVRRKEKTYFHRDSKFIHSLFIFFHFHSSVSWNVVSPLSSRYMRFNVRIFLRENVWEAPYRWFIYFWLSLIFHLREWSLR